MEVLNIQNLSLVSRKLGDALLTDDQQAEVLTGIYNRLFQKPYLNYADINKALDAGLIIKGQFVPMTTIVDINELEAIVIVVAKYRNL